MVVQIDLISDDDNSNIGARLLIELLDPLLALFEGLSAGDVEHDAGSNGIFVVHLSEGSVPFLAGCVPHLVFHNVVPQIFIFRQKASSNCGLVRR